jgi:hypothetical protein
MRIPTLTDVDKLQRFLSECIDPSRTLRHDTACFHVPPMDDRSEGSINGCTRDSCNSFPIACRRRELKFLSLIFALFRTFRRHTRRNNSRASLRLNACAFASTSYYSSCFLVLIDKVFHHTAEWRRSSDIDGCARMSTITAVSTCGHPRQWRQGLVLMCRTLN